MSNIAKSSKIQLVIAVSIYIITGILQPIVIDYLRLSSLLGHKFLLLPTLANTIGMALCGLLVSSQEWSLFFKSISFQQRKSEAETLLPSSVKMTKASKRNEGHTSFNPSLRSMILCTALVDLISGMSLTFGILLTGGAIFVVFYNSCPAWTALFSRIILKKYLNWIQIASVASVCAGLILNVLGSQIQLSKEGTNPKEGGEDNDSNMKVHLVLIGSFVVLLGSLLHSLMFVISDLTMSMVSYDDMYVISRDNSNVSFRNAEEKKKQKSDLVLTGEIWSCCLGSLETCFMVLWVVIGIILFGFSEKVPGKEEANVDTKVDIDSSSHSIYISVLLGFGGLVLIDAIHATAFFKLLKNVGATTSALLKGVQCLVVMALSALFYCPTEPSQCLTGMKILSALLVLVGVTGYGAGSIFKPNATSKRHLANKKAKHSDGKHDFESISSVNVTTCETNPK